MFGLHLTFSALEDINKILELKYPNSLLIKQFKHIHLLINYFFMKNSFLLTIIAILSCISIGLQAQSQRGLYQIKLPYFNVRLTTEGTTDATTATLRPSNYYKDDQAATFNIVNGLNGQADCISLESVSFPGTYYTFPSEFSVFYRQPFENTQNFKQNSSFKIVPGASGGTTLSIESVFYTGQVLLYYADLTKDIRLRYYTKSTSKDFQVRSSFELVPAPVIPPAPVLKPDLIVSDIWVMGFGTTADAIKLTLKVKNIGSGPLNNKVAFQAFFSMDATLSADDIASKIVEIPPIPSGQEYSVITIIARPNIIDPATGLKKSFAKVIFKVDSNDEVQESDENNNQYSK
jgi:Alpha-L-arabinofuranosidase B (ABFB) domain/CARDB